MNELELQLKKVAQCYDNEALVIETALQIQKDFLIIGEEVSYSGKRIQAYNELYSQLFSIIERYVHLDFQKFVNLMYRIDISEKQIKSLLNDMSINFVDEATRLVIEREFKKVLTRNFYRNK